MSKGSHEVTQKRDSATLRLARLKEYDKLADIIRENLDMKMVYEIIERGGK